MCQNIAIHNVGPEVQTTVRIEHQGLAQNFQDFTNSPSVQLFSSLAMTTVLLSLPMGMFWHVTWFAQAHVHVTNTHRFLPHSLEKDTVTVSKTRDC